MTVTNFGSLRMTWGHVEGGVNGIWAHLHDCTGQMLGSDWNTRHGASGRLALECQDRRPTTSL